MEDVAKLDAELAMPLPGRERRTSTVDAQSATRDLAGFAAWAQAAQGGGR